MATTTTNLGLTKPDETDFYDINIFNENADRIDEAMGGKADRTHKHDVEDINGTLPIEKGGTGGTTVESAQSKLGILTADEIANLYVWKKYPGEPGKSTEEETTDIVLTSKTSIYGSAYTAVYYADEYTFDGDTFALTSATYVGFGTNNTDSTVLSKLEAVKGKYVGLEKSSGLTKIYFIPASATISKRTTSVGTLSTYRMIVDSGNKIKSNSAYLTYVTGDYKTKYPSSGKNSLDGYWYVYHKQMGE